MTTVDENRADDELEDSDPVGETDLEEDEFAEPSEDEEVEGIDEDDGDDEDTEDIDAVVELSSKEQSARSLEIRRAIEERMADKRLHEDLDYLDMDLDD